MSKSEKGQGKNISSFGKSIGKGAKGAPSATRSMSIPPAVPVPAPSRVSSAQGEKKDLGLAPNSPEVALAAFLPSGTWHENFEAIPKIPDRSPDASKLAPELVLTRKRRGQELFQTLVAKYDQDQAKSRNADDRWMRTVLGSGTTSDKLSALVLLAQQAPMYRLKSLDQLLAMAEKKGRRESAITISALKDLFLVHLLPSSRPLIPFYMRPLDSDQLTDNHLIAWYFEDLMKKRYSEFVKVLEQGARDTISHFKLAVVRTVFELLIEKPEQEQQMLSLLVNKLGDSEKTVASKASYYLTLLLERHPAMKLVVVKELETFLHRSNISPRAQYYAIVFLNQIILAKDRSGLSEKLIGIYFSMFTRMLGTRDKDKDIYFGRKAVSSRMLSALLTGVNRAFPFADSNPEEFEKHLNVLFKIAHIATSTKAVQALLLLFQILKAQGTVTDRFYRALYDKLLSHDLYQSSHLSLFINLLYKTLKSDANLDRVSAFIKRLLQVSLYQKPNLICALLYVVSEMLHDKPELKARTTEKVQPSAPLLTRCRSFLDWLSSVEGEAAVRKPLKHEMTSRKDDQEDTKTDSCEDPSLASNPFFTVLQAYDATKRDPAHSHASSTSFYELLALAEHDHPSVSAWAQAILKGQRITYGGDPLRDFELLSFLDRFSYKKPKPTNAGRTKAETPKTGSIMQSNYVSYVDRTEPINSEAFARLPSSKVRPEEQFFHRFFTSNFAEDRRAQRLKDRKRQKPASEGADAGSVSGSEGEGEEEPIAESEINKILEAELDDDFFDEPKTAGGLDDELDMALSDEEAGLSPKSVKSKPPKAPKEDADDEEAFGDLSSDDVDLPSGDDSDDEGLGGNHSYSDLQESDFDDEDEAYGGAIVDSDDGEGDQVAAEEPAADSVFGDFDDFAHLLQDAGKDDINPMQRQWEDRTTSRGGIGKKKKSFDSSSRKASDSGPFKGKKPTLAASKKRPFSGPQKSKQPAKKQRRH